MSADMKDIKRRMQGAVDSLSAEFQGLRTGRASTELLTPITVEAYGATMPLNQVASVAAPEARMLTVTVWDASMTKSVEKAIRESDLGLNPMTEGTVMRIPLPELNEERRTELSRVAGKYAEQARVAVRNVRRDGMDQLKRDEKAGDIGQDQLHKGQDEIQKLTDEFVSKIDTALADKEQDIMQV